MADTHRGHGTEAKHRAEWSLGDGPTLAISILPLIAIRLVAGSMTGWIGAAIANLKLRPDIGVPWMFHLRSMRRMIAYSGGYAFAFALFILLRINQPTGHYSQASTWLEITGFVYLLGAALQLLLFATLGRSSYRTVCGRLSTMPPWALGVPGRQDTAGGSSGSRTSAVPEQPLS